MQWARQEAGYSLSDVAEYLKAEEDTLKQWEIDGKEVRYTTLTKLARYYKRQTAVFFLDKTPKRTKIPKDYRNLNLNSKGLHNETMLAIRRTSRYLSVYRELSNEQVYNDQYKWLKSIRDDNVDSITYLRNILDISIADQKKKKNQTFNSWRKKIEDKLGIFVFQFPINNYELDGFSYIDDGFPYAITVNNKITEKRKIFTLFHELGHIIDGHAGLCLATEVNSTSFNIEAKCNTFAAQFLMPETEMVTPSDYDDLHQLAERMGVSKEAYAIRCKSLRIITDTDFNHYMAIIRQMNGKLKTKKKTDGFGIPRDVISRSQRGDKFYEFVVSNYESQRLNPTVVRDLLDIKVVGLGRPPK